MVSEFFADNNDETSDGINKTMSGVGSDSKRSRNETDDNIEDAKKEVDEDKKITGISDGFTTRFSDRCGCSFNCWLRDRTIVGFFHGFILAFLLV